MNSFRRFPQLRQKLFLLCRITIANQAKIASESIMDPAYAACLKKSPAGYKTGRTLL